MGRYCLVPSCKSDYNSKKNKISIFKVPDRTELLNKWEAAIPGVNKLKPSQSICEKHFEEKFIIRKYIKHDADGTVIAEVPFQRPRLHYSALPTIFDSDRNESPPLSIADDDEADLEVDAKTAAKDRGEPLVRITGRAVVPYRRIEPSNLTEHSYSAKSMAVVTNPNPIPPEKRRFPVTKAPSVDTPREVKQETSSEEPSSTAQPNSNKPSLPPSTSTGTRGWEFSTAIVNERIDPRVARDEDRKIHSAEIPQSWGVSQLSRGPEQKLLFSHARAIIRNGETTPITLKCVTLQSDGALRYHVYGRPVNVPEGQHLRVLEKTSDLPRVLERFERANVCNGVGPVDVFQLRGDQVFQDYFEQWHHNACSLLSRTKRCKNCAHIRKMQLQREARSRKRKTPGRIRSALNPVEEKKLAAMRKRNECLRRAKNRAKLRVSLLLESLNK